jgi:hypothetical protein
MLFDGDGNRMTPSHAVKKGTRYRYYAELIESHPRRYAGGAFWPDRGQVVDLPVRRLDDKADPADLVTFMRWTCC